MNSGPERFTGRRIFKYEIKIEPFQAILMPKGAKVLHVGRQGPMPYLWASVDPTMPMEARAIRVVTTGEVFNEERLWYLGTIQLGGDTPKQAWFVMHVYEVETALPMLHPDPVEGRFQGDLDELRRELRAVADADESEQYESGELVPPHRKVPA